MKGVIYMAMWKFRGCPRCGGDVFLDMDMEDFYEQCLQCSYRHELKSTAEFQERDAKEEKSLVLAGVQRVNKRAVH